MVDHALPLEERAAKADLVCKAIAVSGKIVSDPWFHTVTGYPVHQTELTIVSVIKRVKPKTLLFRHYGARCRALVRGGRRRRSTQGEAPARARVPSHRGRA